MSNEIVKATNAPVVSSVFSNSASFEHAQRIAKMLCASSLVPAAYQGNVSNTLVALEMANRAGASPLMVMQNLNVIQGRPSWSAQFVIASINTCGRFSPLQWEVEDKGNVTVDFAVWVGEKPNRRKETRQITVRNLSCVAFAYDASGTLLKTPPVTVEMAVKEGWYTKTDSKWPTMPEKMLRYRAASDFGSLFCPEIKLGMQTTEELKDYIEVIDAPTVARPYSPENGGEPTVATGIEALNQAAAAAASAEEPATELSEDDDDLV